MCPLTLQYNEHVFNNNTHVNIARDIVYYFVLFPCADKRVHNGSMLGDRDNGDYIYLFSEDER